MSVRGNASHSKPGAKKKTFSFSGKLKPAQWAEFAAKVKALCRRYGLTVSVAARRGRKKK